MKGHVLHLPWLHGVVPGVWVVVGHSLDCMNMLQIFVSFICNQWWLAKDFGHLCMYLQNTPVLQNDVPYTIVEGWYRRLEISLSSAVVTQLGCNICCPRISFKAFFSMLLGVVFTDEEVSHFISILCKICIIWTQLMKAEELWKWNGILLLVLGLWDER